MDNVRDQLMRAIEKSLSNFKSITYGSKSRCQRLFADIKFEDIILVTHSLMGFHLENYYSQINLKGGAIVLCMEHPKADIQILKNFSLYGIKYYCAHTSKQPPPIKGVKENLRIVIINYLETRETRVFPISDEEKYKIKTAVQDRNTQVSDDDFKSLQSK